MNLIKRKPQIIVTEAQRDAIEAGLEKDFGILQVRFDEESGRPMLGLKELQTVLPALCEGLVSTELEAPFSNDGTTHIVRAIFIRRDLRVARSGQAYIGEKLSQGETVVTPNQAIGLAEFRAWINAQDGIGFDLTRALLETYCPDTALVHSLSENVPYIELSKLRVQLNDLLKKRGYITQHGNTIDRSAADQLLSYRFDTSDSQALTASQLKDLISFLKVDYRKDALAQAA